MKRFMAGVASIGLAIGPASTENPVNAIDRLPSAESAQAQSDENPCDDPLIGSFLDGVAIATGYESCEEMYDVDDTKGDNSPSLPDPITKRYVALGDSVAAGLGLTPVELPVGDDIVCGRSSQAYPEIVASDLGLSLSNIACKGATVGDLFTEQHLRGTSQDIEPQLDAAFVDGPPEVITITAGANDMYWTLFARQCYRTECGGVFDDLTARSLIRAMGVKLKLALEDIDLRSDYDPPEVFVTGYYNPISSECNDIDPNITDNEIAWFTRQWNRLNRNIKRVTERHDFAEYVPIDFTGHDMCSEDSWVQGLGSPAPFHPTVTGQQVIAGSVLSAIDS